MKIVALIADAAGPTRYFANAIHSEYGLACMVAEQPAACAPPDHNDSRPALFSVERCLRSVLFRVEQRRRQRAKQMEQVQWENKCNELFGNLWRDLNPAIPLLATSDVNSEAVRAKLAAIKPDVILDHGTTIVKEHILSLAPLTLNLHWGLSPYYRGVNCTERALFHWDPLNIGVTIHKLANQIDGGDILGQARVVVNPRESHRLVPLQLTKLGTAIVSQALRLLAAGETLKFQRQATDTGFLFQNRHWTVEFQTFLDNLDERQLQKIVGYPSRPALPIVEL